MAWKNAAKEVDSINSVYAETLASFAPQGKIPLIDVCKKSEFDSEHVEYAVNLLLDDINNSMALIDKSKTYYVY